MVAKAQDRMRTGRLTKQGYAERHRRLTERLLAAPQDSRKHQIDRAAAPLGLAPEPEARQPSRNIQVFVLLGHGFGINRWCDRYERGLIPGLN
jgi:hypothetical protein